MVFSSFNVNRIMAAAMVAARSMPVELAFASKSL
jgi:hypothetical protein